MNSHTWEHAPLATAVVSLRSSGALACQELYDATGEACLEVTYSGQHKGQVVSSLCPPSVGVWIESVDCYKDACLASGCL